MNLKKIIVLLLALPALFASSVWAASEVHIMDIKHSIIRMSLDKGVTPEDAIQAIRSRAQELNLKNVGHQDVSKEVKARGVDYDVPRLEIFQYCTPEDAIAIVRHDPTLAAYMPCRITLVEDNMGNFWLTMINLDMIINNAHLPPNLLELALRVNGNMLEIMAAGVKGAF